MSHQCMIMFVIVDVILSITCFLSFGLSVDSQEVRLKRSSPLWGGRPANKRCIDFCRFINCNAGVCILNPETCRLTCNCHDGYTGERCTDVIEIENKEDQTNSSNDVIRISLSISSTFSNDKVRKPVTSDDRDVTTLRPVTSLFENRNDLIRVPAKRLSNVREIHLTTQKLHPNQGLRTDFLTITNNKPVTDKPKTTTSIQTVSDIQEIQTTTQNVLSVKENHSVWNSDVILKKDGLLSLDYHPKNAINNTVKQPKPFQSIYLDDCRENCQDGLCIALNQSFHCLPKQQHCQNGFYCGEHGVCDPEYIAFKKYKCLCEPGWIGDTCSKVCDLDCGINGICELTDVTKNVKKCICRKSYTGVRCDKLIPKPVEAEEEIWHLYIVGVCVSLAVLLIALIIIVPYWMWKKRWIFVMKIVHYFQQYEEDDGKEFDAFISYKSSKEDQDFVLHQLYPKLEGEMGFKICLHFRDFTPGNAIANNIIQAIENSRRTIMILSPNYVESEWCRMEYQKAQHEMLKLKHKIIPIMFKDVSECSGIDKNLKTILNTVTYLEWPEDENSKKIERFWKQLELTLPKKRALQTAPATISSSSSPSNVTSIIPTSCSNDALIANVTSYASPIATETSQENESEPRREVVQLENKTQRIKKLMKDVLKLKINPATNSFTRLSREVSVESGIVTPLSATPSPGMCGVQDVTPLLARKKAPHKRSKSLTWSEKTLKHILLSDTKNRSLRDRECSRRSIDVVPPSPDGLISDRTNLPDICRTDDLAFYNIVCEESLKDENTQTKHQNKNHADCNTCVISSYDNNIYESLTNEGKGNNIPSSSSVCPTCIHNGEIDDQNNVTEDSSCSKHRNDVNYTSVDNDNVCVTCVYPRKVINNDIGYHNSQRKCENDTFVQNISGNSSEPNIHVCESHVNITQEEQETCPTCILSRRDPLYDVKSNNVVSRRSSTKSSFRIQPYGHLVDIANESSTKHGCDDKHSNISEVRKSAINERCCNVEVIRNQSETCITSATLDGSATLPVVSRCSVTAPTVSYCSVTVPTNLHRSVTVPTDSEYTAAVRTDLICSATVPMESCCRVTIPTDSHCTITIPTDSHNTSTIPTDSHNTSTIPTDLHFTATTLMDSSQPVAPKRTKKLQRKRLNSVDSVELN